MSNIVTYVQENLGLQKLDKIDPNNQQEKPDLQASTTADHFTQAAITATLVGLYKFGTTDEGARELLRPRSGGALLQNIFGNDRDAIISAVSNYGNRSYEETSILMQKIADAGMDCVLQNTGNKAMEADIKTYLAGQRHNILVYLPADLEVGKILHDNTIEDRTNKMEGPVSSFMHFIEDMFAQKEEQAK